MKMNERKETQMKINFLEITREKKTHIMAIISLMKEPPEPDHQDPATSSG